MDPEITQDEAIYYLNIIRKAMREQGRGLDEAEDYAKEVLGFRDYRSLVYYAQHGTTPESDPEAATARVHGTGALGKFGKAMLAGIPFSDEVADLMSPGAGERMRADRRVLREDFPGATFASEMIPQSLIPMGAGKAIAGRAARAGMGSLGTGFGGATAGAAAEGGLYGLGEGQGTQDRLVKGALGAGTGAAMGGLFGLGAVGIGGTGRRLARQFRPAQAAEVQGTEHARRWLRGWQHDTGLNPDQIDASLARLGPDAVVADVAPIHGGRGIYAARSLAGGGLDQPGGPSMRLQGRRLNRGQRLSDELARVSDSRGIPVQGKVDEAVDLMRRQAQDEFYGPLDDEFGEFALSDIPELEEFVFSDPELTQGAQLMFGDVRRPLRFSDFQKWRDALRDRHRRMLGDPQVGVGVKENLQRQINQLTQVMQDSFPGVAQGDQLWARAAAAADAYGTGLKLGANQSPLKLQRKMNIDLRNMGGEERAALLAGVMDTLDQKIIDSPTGGSAGSKFVNEAPGTREWLTHVLGEEGMAQLDNAVKREQAFQNTDLYGGLNSLTGMRVEDIAGMKSNVPRPPVNRWEALRRTGEYLTNMVGIDRATGMKVGEALMAGDTQPLRAILNAQTMLRGSGEMEAIMAAAAQSPLNQYLLGTYLMGGPDR